MLSHRHRNCGILCLCEMNVFYKSQVIRSGKGGQVNDKKKCSPCNGETVTRSFKIYKNVLDDFVNFCNNSKYTQYELLSQFILEGIQKYS